MYIIYAVIAFSLLIIVHELGHFILAKLNGVKVLEFSLGMGPKLFGIQGEETEYNLKLFPMGGSVRMYGDEELVEDERAFSNKKPLQKIFIIAAGAFMNYVLAIFLFTLIAYNFGFKTPIVAGVVEKSPALEAGIMQGDEITKVNGKKLVTAEDLTYEIAMNKGAAVEVQFRREGKDYTKSIVPMKAEDNRLIIGIDQQVMKKPSIPQSINQSMKLTISNVTQTFSALKGIFAGKANLKTDVGGPVTIIKISGAAAKAGIWNLVWLTAFLSVQLAVFNLLPFPALDGGWIIILLIELISGKKVPDKVIGVLNMIGFAALMLLMVLVTAKDLLFPINL